MARYMVTRCGMNDVVGPQYLASGDERGGAPMSDETRNAVDAEVRRMLVDAKEEVKTLLTTRMEVGGVWEHRGVGTEEAGDEVMDLKCGGCTLPRRS